MTALVKSVSVATVARPPSRRWRRTGWWTIAVLILITLAVVVPQYAGMNPAHFLAQQREVYLRRETMLGLHICGAATALAIGPFQFLPRLRRGHARVHRIIGITYLTAATIGGLGGLGMAPTAYTGPVASIGFGTMAVLWLTCTWTGFAMVMRHRFTDHRRWMIRSFSLVFGGVTLRLLLGSYIAVEGSVDTWLSFHTVYMAASWLCWVPNLALALWLTRTRPASTVHPQAAPHPGASAATLVPAQVALLESLRTAAVRTLVVRQLHVSVGAPNDETVQRNLTL